MIGLWSRAFGLLSQKKVAVAGAKIIETWHLVGRLRDLRLRFIGRDLLGRGRDHFAGDRILASGGERVVFGERENRGRFGRGGKVENMRVRVDLLSSLHMCLRCGVASALLIKSGALAMCVDQARLQRATGSA